MVKRPGLLKSRRKIPREQGGVWERGSGQDKDCGGGSGFRGRRMAVSRGGKMASLQSASVAGKR